MRQIAAIFLCIAFTLTGCSSERWISIRYGGLKRSRQHKAKERAFKKIETDIYAKSDTVLKLWCYQHQCRIAEGNIFWVYSENNRRFLRKVNMLATPKILVYDPQELSAGSKIINMILENRVDTVKSRPTDWKCYDCGWIGFLLTVNRDTVLDSYVEDIDFEKGDSTHIKYKLGALIADELNKSETTNANNR